MEAENMLLTASEAGRRLSYCSMSIRRKIKSGELPAVRIGRRYFIDTADLDRLIVPVVAGKRAAAAEVENPYGNLPESGGERTAEGRK